MTARPPPPDNVTLRGLRAMPAQVLGALRLVPLVRENVRGDLRLARGGGDAAGAGCAALVAPHGLVAGWDDGAPTAVYGTQLLAPHPGGSERRRAQGPVVARVEHRRDALRAVGARDRVLPLAPTLEGLVARRYDAPPATWSAYALRQPVRAPRRNAGASVEEAARVSEVHERQCGLLVLAGDTLLAALAVPHPDDYLALHRAWLEDLLAGALADYGRRGVALPSFDAALAGAVVRSLDDLRRALDRARVAWAGESVATREGLFPRKLVALPGPRLGGFSLFRVATELVPTAVNHVGEVVLREGGEVEVLLAFWLSAAQVRRAYLFEQVALRGWDLERAAVALRTTRDGLLQRLDAAGFRYALETLARDAPRGRLR